MQVRLKNNTGRRVTDGEVVRIYPNTSDAFIVAKLTEFGIIGTVSGTIESGQYGTINLINTIDYSKLLNIPTEFTPKAHTHQKTYASLAIDIEAIITADSVSVTDGTITDGDVTSTYIVDQSYLTVNESGKFDIQFSFTGLTNMPAQCLFEGWYEGNPAHVVWLYIWDFNLSAWERVTAETTDFPSATEDYSLQFNLPDGEDYLSAGECRLRIYHDSNAVGSHNMYIDYIGVIQETITLDVPGTYYPMTDFTLNAKSSDIVVDASAGTVTIPANGDYKIDDSASFNASVDSKIELSLFVNGVKLATSWRRHMNITGDVGSASSSAIRTLLAGDILSWRFTSDTPLAYVSIIAMHCVVIKVSN